MEKNGRIRILLVDDHEVFRRYVASMLKERANVQIVGEAEDGLQAVMQAEALQPDVILLDIGLPGINGIEVARQIGEIANKARIIFLTQESSAEVVNAAFELGAWGYITKVCAGAELLSAVDAVSQGERLTNENSHNHNSHNNKVD